MKNFIKKFKREIDTITSFLFITGCQTTNEGNLIQRAYILDKNEKSYTFRYIDTKCSVKINSVFKDGYCFW